ncbi:hypothetical protein JRO89_XS02G0073500 [Xanthoceras sorbifolium]|uniref:Diacylglycerol O-acyltransferase n=1 Tax=Xanthoceras sorbifolium TaxID=99658 RepID=A0ABQ8IFI8_9ROSI|nr:hypothetical protein JRO89_XS02G0073500 [Xanthoceras sorbifolium]
MVSSDGDEPLTPAGRLFLRPEMNTIIHCVVGLQHPPDLDLIKSIVSSSFMVQHPRFTSLLVRDHRGTEHWRKTKIDIDRHVILVDHPLTNDVDDSRAVNDYVAELSVSTPLSTDKPLWELHVLPAHKCVVLRIHHALGDGISLMSLFLASCRRAADPEALPSMGISSDRKRSRSSGWRNWREILLGFVKMVVFSLVFAAEFVLKLWISDRKTPISGGADVELWPRKLATARFSLEDMKAVKKAVADRLDAKHMFSVLVVLSILYCSIEVKQISHCISHKRAFSCSLSTSMEVGHGNTSHKRTINDVLFGVVSSGLSRYLDYRSPNALPNGFQLTGLAMVNLREQPGLQELCDLMKSNTGSEWGNKFGMLLLPVYYHKTGGNPLDYLKRAKAMIDRKKQSLEAHFSYNIGDFLMSWFGPKVACMLNYRIVCNTSFTISNVIGPLEEITVAGVPVTYVRANTSSLPHALTMHMTSYAGKADMQILVAKDIIPDPEFLAKCFEDALPELKEAALSTKI